MVRRAARIARLSRPERRAPDGDDAIEEMSGTSASIRRIFQAITKVAGTEVPILITGESGTGKEVTARAIHARSARRDGPFVPINCGAIPETLLEAELFGYERGAFTGAVQQKKGKVEYAQHGTLFLDEVGELPLTLQVKLLRFLQDRTFDRVGGRQPIEMNVRIMAATNVDLKKAIEQGTFREDLYYRLGVVNIHLPPLRDREEDVLLLAVEFLRQASQHHRKRVVGFSKEALHALKAYAWPGNVRELCNKIRRAVVMAEGVSLTPEDLDLPFDREAAVPPISLRQARRRMEADVIAQAFMLHRGNLRRAAAELGVSRPTLYRLLRQYGLAEKVRHAC
jgi:two-component system NtrC family response regulator